MVLNVDIQEWFAQATQAQERFNFTFKTASTRVQEFASSDNKRSKHNYKKTYLIFIW